jgi:HEAT repeat protein
MTMKIITIAAATVLAATPALAATQARSSYDRSYERPSVARESRASRADLGAPRAGPEIPALRQGDPADSLYRLGREALNRRNYSRAAELFKSVTDRFPRSPSAPSAMYFRAFSLSQSGSVDKMRESRDVLTALAKNYPNADLADAKSLRARVCGELAQRGDSECAEEISRVADRDSRADDRTTRGQASQRTSCSEDEDDERVVALNALLQMDGERALPLLKRVLERRDTCSYVLRRKAVFLVSQKGGEEAADILMQAAKNDPDRETREQAVFWLGQTGSDRAVTLLEDVLKSSDDRQIKDKALFALSQHRSSRAGQILRDFAERASEETELREQAIFWLGQKRSEENANYLKGLYARVRTDALKEKIIFSLSQQRSFGNAEWIMNIALDPKESIEMRKHALFWAGQNGGASTESFAALYDKMSDSEIKEQLIFVLSQRGRDGKAIDKLMDIAKNDKDKELRGKAVFWLGQSRDPRALKYLEDLISKP